MPEDGRQYRLQWGLVGDAPRKRQRQRARQLEDAEGWAAEAAEAADDLDHRAADMQRAAAAARRVANQRADKVAAWYEGDPAEEEEEAERPRSHAPSSSQRLRSHAGSAKSGKRPKNKAKPERDPSEDPLEEL